MASLSVVKLELDKEVNKDNIMKKKIKKFAEGGYQNRAMGLGANNSSIVDMIQNQTNRVGGLGANNSSIASLIQNQNRVGGLKKASSRLKKGGKVSSASKRADGCITKGKTKGKMV